MIVLLCSMLVGALIVLLWPQSHWRMSLWFWCCVVVLPLIAGLVVYALRLLAYERRGDYTQSWNQSREEQEQVLIRQGRRAVALLASAYCTGAGNNQIAQALRRGSKPLQPVYLESMGQTMRLSQLAPQALRHTQEEYAQRLAMCMQQLLTGLDSDLQRYACSLPLCVRIRHNQVLGDEEVLSLWRSARRREKADDQVLFATQDDGLIWLDTWLDDPGQHRLLLSLEINLFVEPVAEHAESVSAVLLAVPDEGAAQKVAPMAWIHRPVRIADPACALQDAFFWGGIPPGNSEYFTWLTQIPFDVLRDVSIALSAAGYPFDVAKYQSLDNSFGLPGCAVGNVALLLACEQASVDRQAQVVILQDASAQVFVAQPA
ncbi:hypothetical protein HBR94_04215 [Pseudomonas sp. WS 5412]|uniref:hypothetical protein n=1 Tax=Pseudomonas sp. WS 5412 TaxID=2717487 RepID=UPI001472D1AB|nr:hypothetical protein [Pseudomonas sp. WS 5412]NMY30707.1 hypothetical protein [Pseudomonas sp. WS 5412]